MAQLRRDDAGNTGATFYQVTLEPHDWYKWFQSSKSPPKSNLEFEAGTLSEEEEEEEEEPKADSEEKDTNDASDDSGWTQVCNAAT